MGRQKQAINICMVISLYSILLTVARQYIEIAIKCTTIGILVVIMLTRNGFRMSFQMLAIYICFWI